MKPSVITLLVRWRELFLKYWNDVLVAVGTIGAGIASLLPSQQEHVTFFLVMAGMALVLTVLKIEWQIASSREELEARFGDVRYAYEKRKVLDDLKTLGYVGSLSNRNAVGEVIANLPDETRIIRILSFSGAFNFNHPGAIRRLRELAGSGNTKMEFVVIDPESPFVDGRSSEHDEWSPSSLADRARSEAGRLRKVLEEFTNIQREHTHETSGLRQYRRWVIWRMVILDDEKLYVSFYPIGKPGAHSKVWIFERDDEGRSMFWPLFKQYFACKYFDEVSPTGLSPVEIIQHVREEIVAHTGQ